MPERASPGARTRFVGVIGDPVSSSRSPDIHNAAFAALGIDACYGAFLVREGDVKAAIDGARALNMLGLSVTMPHKAAAAAAAEQAGAEVAALGVANTIVFRGGVSVAYNTDGTGFVEDVVLHTGIELAGARCAVLGAGGAARAVVLALGEAGAGEVVVVARDASRAEAVAGLAEVARAGEAGEVAGAGLVVNATPLGMAGEATSAPDLAAIEALCATLGGGQLVVDLVTSSPETPLMAAARRRGAAVRGGIGMLVHQAAHQFELFTGRAAPLEAMWAAVGGPLPDEAGR